MDTPERRERLANAIDIGDQLRALAQHPEIERWFKAQEEKWIEVVLSAADEPTRIAAVARVQATRGLRDHLTAVDVASQQAIRKLRTLNEAQV